MIDQDDLQEELESLADDDSVSGWDEAIICRVEVDLPGWLTQLAGGNQWEVYAEDEDEACISFNLREKLANNVTRKAKAGKTAEVTLYHNGYAVVDVEGQALFDGTLTSGTSECAHLSYYHADSGEPVTLN
ncbi:MAG: hypothetical protein ABGX03_03740 [Methylophilaceae bacterium]